MRKRDRERTWTWGEKKSCKIENFTFSHFFSFPRVVFSFPFYHLYKYVCVICMHNRRRCEKLHWCCVKNVKCFLLFFNFHEFSLSHVSSLNFELFIFFVKKKKVEKKFPSISFLSNKNFPFSFQGQALDAR